MWSLEPISYIYYKNVLCQDLIYMRNFKNIMELPEIVQCFLNSSSNDALKDPKRLLPVETAIQLVSCQKGRATRSRKSIASFQLRRGNLLGYATSLRGMKIYSFLDLYIFLVSPQSTPVPFPGGSRREKAQEKKLFRDKIKTQTAHYNFGEEKFTLFPGLETHFLTLSTVGGFNCTLSIPSGKKGELPWLLAWLQFPVQES